MATLLNLLRQVKNILPSGNGGTGNGFTKFTGATTSEKSYALPDQNATLLYSGGALGTPLSGDLSSTTNVPVNQSNTITNLGLATSVAANALTIALKDASGSTPSSTSAARIGFRNSTATTGTYNIRSITGALSLVVPSTATLGMSNGVAYDLYVYALDNAGTVELGVSMTAFEDGSIQSTTAIAGGSNTNNVIYSTTARTNVPVRLIGKINITEATAGTWASNATTLSVAPFAVNPIYAYYKSSAGQSITNGTIAIINYGTIVEDTHNAVTTGASWAFVAPKTSKYAISGIARYADSQNWSVGSFVAALVEVNGSVIFDNDLSIQVTAVALATGPGIEVTGTISLAKNDSLNIRTTHNESTSRTLSSYSGAVYITITEIKSN